LTTFSPITFTSSSEFSTLETPEEVPLSTVWEYIQVRFVAIGNPAPITSVFRGSPIFSKHPDKNGKMQPKDKNWQNRWTNLFWEIMYMAAKKVETKGTPKSSSNHEFDQHIFLFDLLPSTLPPKRQ
jgi:hypothetical protein